MKKVKVWKNSQKIIRWARLLLRDLRALSTYHSWRWNAKVFDDFLKNLASTILILFHKFVVHKMQFHRLCLIGMLSENDAIVSIWVSLEAVFYHSNPGELLIITKYFPISIHFSTIGKALVVDLFKNLFTKMRKSLTKNGNTESVLHVWNSQNNQNQICK